MEAKLLDTTHHDRRLAQRIKEDPEFRAEFERHRRQIAQANVAIEPVKRTMPALVFKNN